jgi:cytochrome c-type protein NapB
MRGLKVKTLTVMLLAVFLLAVAACSSTPAKETAKAAVSEDEMGLRRQSLYGEQDVMPAMIDYADCTPVSGKRFERSFENSPPLIPHDLTGMLPIAEKNNMCLQCHLPEKALMTGAVAIPKTHMMDLERNQQDLHGKLAGARYNCMACHVPQVNLPPLVKNIFEGNFRDVKDKYNSNLADTLNEGVRAE